MPIGDDPIFSMLRTGLEWAQLRQRVLAENVADADTPQFRPRDLAPLTFDFKIITAHRQSTNGRRCAAGGEGGVHHNEDDPTIKGKLKQMSNAKVRKRKRTCRSAGDESGKLPASTESQSSKTRRLRARCTRPSRSTRRSRPSTRRRWRSDRLRAAAAQGSRPLSPYPQGQILPLRGWGRIRHSRG